MKESTGRNPADHQPTSVRIVCREPKVARRAVVERSDFRLAVSLPVYTAVAWSVPVARWHDLIRRWFASIDEKGPLQKITDGIELSGLTSELDGDSEAIARELNANRLESYLQYLQDYRPGRWRCVSSIDNEGALRSGIDHGRGVILWVGHFVFNGLPLKKAIHEAGYRVFHLSRPEHGFSSSRFGIAALNPIRSHIECRYLAQRVIIERGREHLAMLDAHRLLSRGEIVSITAGHWEGRRIALAPIGDAFLPIAIGAPSIAYATGATLLPLFIIFERGASGGEFRVVVGNPIDHASSEGRDVAVRCAVVDFAQQLIPFVMRYPDQWRGWKYLQTSRSCVRR